MVEMGLFLYVFGVKFVVVVVCLFRLTGRCRFSEESARQSQFVSRWIVSDTHLTQIEWCFTG